MKATDQFVTRAEVDGSFVKVVLSPDRNVYLYQHKGVNFFIHRDHWSGLWNAIESRSGSSIVTDYYTKKECLKCAMQYINDVLNIGEAIKHQLDLTRSATVMSEDEYIAMGD